MTSLASPPRGPRRAIRKAVGAARCPCDSGAVYEACCGPLHRYEREAPDAVALMRSRYAAFARANYPYLWETLHPDHDDYALGRDALIASASRSNEGVRYEALRVLDASREGDHARVLFAAHLTRAGRDDSFLEASDFVLDGARWRYLYGSAAPHAAVGRAVGLTLADFDAHAFETR